jgi:hypothetical protein
LPNLQKGRPAFGQLRLISRVHGTESPWKIMDDLVKARPVRYPHHQKWKVPIFSTFGLYLIHLLSVHSFHTHSNCPRPDGGHCQEQLTPCITSPKRRDTYPLSSKYAGSDNTDNAADRYAYRMSEAVVAEWSLISTRTSSKGASPGTHNTGVAISRSSHLTSRPEILPFVD